MVNPDLGRVLFRMGPKSLGPTKPFWRNSDFQTRGGRRRRYTMTMTDQTHAMTFQNLTQPQMRFSKGFHLDAGPVQICLRTTAEHTIDLETLREANSMSIGSARTERRDTPSGSIVCVFPFRSMHSSSILVYSFDCLLVGCLPATSSSACVRSGGVATGK